MLFSYTYVPHQLERMQRFINFIFYQVWCRAPKLGAYDLSLFDGNLPLKEVMVSFAYDDTKAGDRFSSQVQAIYESFSKLPRREISKIKKWYQANNNIQQICANHPTAQIARYSDIAISHKGLGDQLAAFFKELYSQSLLDLAALRAKIGDIDNHYEAFVRVNDAGKCPFCGINDLLGGYHSKREAYDHYLPKKIYPFNSINFKNLVPACHHCNSSYKTSKDPAYTPKDPARDTLRRKFFYPYATVPRAIELHVSLQHAGIDQLTPAEITLTFGPDAISEEIDTWRDVYAVEERYKAKILGKNDGKYWLTQVLDEWGQNGRLPSDYLASLTRQAERHPYAECNFLKKPFLEACRQIGLFDLP
ncbi:HNH endonuclease [Stutzerimonas nitrititolerans]|uniref:HNH endonuclease n=1 Tax=Stutzerimonas nitrititolerans TaxID=2482751 RepID=UPI00289FA2BE|nr:hypothetical protein [Stutzerimonas nitrititolerans]